MLHVPLRTAPGRFLGALACGAALVALIALPAHANLSPIVSEKALCPMKASDGMYKRTTRAIYTAGLTSTAADRTTDGCECYGSPTWLEFAHCAMAKSYEVDYPHKYTGVRFWFCNHRASELLAPKSYATVDGVAAALNELNPVMFENWQRGGPSRFTFSALLHGAVWGFRLANESVKLEPTCNLFPGVYAHLTCFHAFGHAMWYSLVPQALTSPLLSLHVDDSLFHVADQRLAEFCNPELDVCYDGFFHSVFQYTERTGKPWYWPCHITKKPLSCFSHILERMEFGEPTLEEPGRHLLQMCDDLPDTSKQEACIFATSRFFYASFQAVLSGNGECASPVFASSNGAGFFDHAMLKLLLRIPESAENSLDAWCAATSLKKACIEGAAAAVAPIVAFMSPLASATWTSICTSSSYSALCPDVPSSGMFAGQTGSAKGGAAMDALPLVIGY